MVFLREINNCLFSPLRTLGHSHYQCLGIWELFREKTGALKYLQV